MHGILVLTSNVLPGVIFPGHHAKAGTLIPPSKVLPLPHLSGPAFPPLISLNNDGLQINLHRYMKVSTE